MTCPVATALRHSLHDWRNAPSWCVALSGGLDSSVLLHALVQWARQETLPPIRAIYIDHGLQQAAADWPQHCRMFCQQLEIPLQVISVKVEQGASLEQTARAARYTAFIENLQPEELLLLAQHQDDQAETLLLRLLRGAGVKGLSGMPITRRLEQARLLRPLLQVPLAQLQDYAIQQQLCWVEDPTNQADEYDRNFLRNRVIPLLQQRWPGLGQVFQRTAQHMQETDELLIELARQDLQRLTDSSAPTWLQLPSLAFAPLQQLSLVRQKNLLRFWLADKTLPPDTAHWAGWQDLCAAGQDAKPLWQLDSGTVLRDGNRLYWLGKDWQPELPQPMLELDEPGQYELVGNGSLQVSGSWQGRLRIAYRVGGERIHLPERGSRDLKRFLQEQKIPYFVRSRIPLGFIGDELVTVANCQLPGRPQLIWQL